MWVNPVETQPRLGFLFVRPDMTLGDAPPPNSGVILCSPCRKPCTRIQPNSARRSSTTSFPPGGTLALMLFIYIATRPEPKPIVLGATDRSLAISPIGTLLAVGTRDGSLRLIGAESGHTLALAQLPASIEVVAFGPDDTVLALLQSQNLLYIFSNDLKTHSERLVQAHPRDVIWSQALGGAIGVAGGADDIHPSLQFFPAQPLGIANSTSQLFDLREWAAPVNVAATADGSRVAVTLDTNRRANVIFYDPEKRRVAATALVSGKPRGVAIAPDGSYTWVVGATAE